MRTQNPNVAGGQHSGKPKIGRLLKDCGLSGAELARRVGVFPSTVSSWVTGRTESPGAVLAYLELLRSIRVIAR